MQANISYATQRPVTETHFKTHDGEQLFYRYWAKTSTAPRKGLIVLFHRGHEHSGRMAHLVDELNLPDYDFAAWDARGHGHSPGQRGYSPSFGTSVRDVQTFMDHLCKEHDTTPENIYVVAQSVGAVVISTWLHDYAPKVRGATLASPAFKVKLYVPFARTGLAIMQKLRGLFFVNSYVKAKFLTHDEKRIASYEADPLITRPIAVNILLGLYEAAERVVKDSQAITTPIQLLISGADWVVHRAPQEQFFAGLASPLKSMKVLPGFYHDTLGEKDRAGAVADIRDCIETRFAQMPQRVNLRDADKHGATAQEAVELSRDLAALSPKGLYWSIFKANLKFGGLLSEGVKLGHQTGFDSGSTLDYVYRNEARGVPVLGTIIDRNYLNAIGWRGIRQRKINVEELLNIGASKLQAEGKSIRMMDVAAGHGRYDLDAVAQMPVQPESILLRDYSDINVRDGAALIRERGLQDRAQFHKADAFDFDSLASVSPAPTLSVVSGLYELFSENDMVARSLAGIAAAMKEGGYLVYTGQPWHPQLELIARGLTSHRQGQAWVMRRRTQAEMDQLVEQAGFRKIEQRIDEFGIFTVSIAQKK
jgi:alpha-beta hydrolase superfamily lysophospholipase